ncbi:hypothetical protein QJV45_02625 [Listeria booriae]|uniref:hypothetical protein n=1 Tax=Listeria booriae TaxID=1552123 RepID=UPI0028803818|nr:hypothetical protein [Listeria booriae]MDT0109337.1 hypothetical protein [Listeria booriae]
MLGLKLMLILGAGQLPSLEKGQKYFTDQVLIFIWVVVVLLVAKNFASLKVKGALIVFAVGAVFTWGIKNPAMLQRWVDGLMGMFT